MNARMPYHAADVFEQLDTDKDGYLNAMELEYLALVLNPNEDVHLETVSLF